MTLKAPTPPKELQQQQELVEEPVELEKTETIEVILFEYEDENVSFNISFEFVYTFTQKLDPTQVLMS